jgi:hypothetical protein
VFWHSLAGDLTASVVTPCDPIAHVANPFRPGKVYNAPVILQDGTDPRRRTATWFDSDQAHIAALYVEADKPTSTIDATSYVYVTFDGVSGSRWCTVSTETPPSAAFEQPTPEAAGAPEGIRASPTFLGVGPSANVFSNPIVGYLQRYPVTGTGDMIDCSPLYDCQSVDAFALDSAGPDSSALVVGGSRSIAIWGNKCHRDAANCTAPWGSVVAAEISGSAGTFGTVYDQVDLNAWTFSAPVGVSNAAGASSGELLVVLGTDESTSATFGVPQNPAYDCAMATFLWDGSTLALADHWDDDNDPAAGWVDTCNLTGAPDGVNGFVGEPVALGGAVFALRRRGELYRFAVNAATGNIARTYTVRFDDGAGPPDAWRVPAEHAPVVADYPDTLQVERVAMFGMNDTSVVTRSVFVAVDLPTVCAGPLGTTCTVDPLALDMREYSLPAGTNAPVWSAGAAAVYVDDATEEQYLAYVVATGAVVPVDGGSDYPDPLVDCDGPTGSTWVYPPMDCVDNTAELLTHLRACDPDGLADGSVVPPQLHIFYKQAADAVWQEDTVNLGQYCYEDDPLVAPFEWEPIEVVSPVTIYGTKVYIATDDGRFWEIDTAASPLGRRLQGCADGWPRFRHDNDGRARTF